MNRTLMFSFIFLLFFPFFAFSQDIPKYSARVKINCSSNSDVMEITSYLTRELRSLNDVSVVENNPDWELSIIVLETITKSGMKIGIVFSVVILKPISNEVLKFYLTEVGKLRPDQVAFIDLAKNDLYNFRGHWIDTGSKDDMRYICQRVVAQFDSGYLDKRKEVVSRDS